MGYWDKEVDFLLQPMLRLKFYLLESASELHSCRDRTALPSSEGGLFLQENSVNSSQLPSKGAVPRI